MEKGLLPALLASVSLKGRWGKRESLHETSGQFKAADFFREGRAGRMSRKCREKSDLGQIGLPHVPGSWYSVRTLRLLKRLLRSLWDTGPSCAICSVPTFDPASYIRGTHWSGSGSHT